MLSPQPEQGRRAKQCPTTAPYGRGFYVHSRRYLPLQIYRLSSHSIFSHIFSHIFLLFFIMAEILTLWNSSFFVTHVARKLVPIFNHVYTFYISLLLSLSYYFGSNHIAYSWEVKKFSQQNGSDSLEYMK